MTQKSANRKRKAPAYSADTMALRMLAGLALTALGAVMFMAVDLRMRGNVFDGLRDVCFGLCGILAYALPALPVWAGVLVIWSTQRKAPAMPWLYTCLGFLGLCAFLVLVTHTNTLDYIGYLKSSYLSSAQASEWGGCIQSGYLDGMRHEWSGGAVGVVFAWPLWKYLGSFLGAVITLLLTLLCALMAVSLTPVRIWRMINGQAGKLRDQQQARQTENTQRQVAWQQEQARQRMLWEQEQQRILEQQQAAQARGSQQGYTAGLTPAAQASASSIMEWQRQNADRQLADSSAGTAHESRIFGRRQKTAQNGQEAGEERPRKSRIFGKREANDGLTDPAVLQDSETQAAAGRRTATGKVISQPATRWNTAEVDRYRRPAEDPAKSEAERKTAQEDRPAVPEDPPAVRENRPVRTDRQAEENKAGTAVQESREESMRDREISENGAGTRRKIQQTDRSAETPARERNDENSWRSQVQNALDAERRKTEEKDAGLTGGRRSEEKHEVKVPAVQQVIGEAAWKPDIKVPPKSAEEEPEEEYWTPRVYIAPPITDLKPPAPNTEDTAAEDEMRSRRLEETLASFKVQAHVVNVTHGPAISRFELEIAAGTKVTKVSGLEKDIAYNMEATSVRIEAPISGKSLVGVEVPNRKVSTVTLREVLESERMQSAKSVLTVALGKDIAGTPIVCDLARMPHMLIAGQTGSGKSVCINAIINSLLYRAGPDEVKLILVDPKVVELQCYNGIPHLLIPVVNDPHKAAAALAWAVAEMMERYDKFALRKVRNLDGYNSILAPGEKPMARIVIIIDELADLMMVCKKDVEEYICRLTQLARAAGIHLIVATQRPSVDVITGLIKANIPSRIAFKTASSVDSRTILDRNGSEQLLGWGDMLYLPTGSFTPTRVQGCFLSDEEVNQIVEHVRVANPAGYDPDILEKLEQLAGGSAADLSGADMAAGTGEMGEGDGGLFEQAVEFAISDGQISTSTLQRRLKIGYARAGRLTDEMEERGIIAAKDGSKPRKCLITREEWERMKKE